MSDVVHTLKVAEKPVNTTMLEHFDEECKRIRADLEERPNSGFVIVAYSRESEDEVHQVGGYYFNDIMDRFWLPDFVRETVRVLLYRDG